MKKNDIDEMIELMDLQKKLMYRGFDYLNLRFLDSLRAEVDFRIERLKREK